ncbi:unnamed protein product [Caenorhabditis angaria]|uniref:G-protein coupled receptors family 1 profile domain-containing protein n=1 Tax=Caenorhabditis angaria TaxID=860376 RepID=A0A9P1IR59_9PELO|nr:unnamed protein product [Caenorhabditis angaria]
MLSEIFWLFQTLTACFGIFINGLLIYTVLFYTPESIKTYSLIILSHAISDFLACLFHIFTHARFIGTEFTISYASSGLCKYLDSPAACDFAYSFYIHFSSFSLYMILVSFSYRWWILTKSSPTSRALLGVCFAFYIPCFLQVIAFCIAGSKPIDIYRVIHKKYPDYDLSGYQINGQLDIRNIFSLYGFCHLLLPAQPIYCIIIFLRFRIIGHLKEAAGHMSKNTRAMHKQLLTCLTIQAMLPMLNIIAISLFALQLFSIFSDPLIEENMLFFLLLIPTISPIVSFVFIKPYRRIILKMAGKKIDEKRDTFGPSSVSKIEPSKM